MNFLAHIYLSGTNKQIQIGNFIGDFVKGKAYETYPEAIKKGILLHRAIDDFTDKHKATKEAILPLKPFFGRYSGVVVDLFYDHCLASEWKHYTEIPLSNAVDQFHQNLNEHFGYLPPRVKQIVPSLIRNRRLETYTEFRGVEKALEIMANRTSLPDKTSTAINILEKNRERYQELTSQLIDNLIPVLRKDWGIEIKKPG